MIKKSINGLKSMFRNAIFGASLIAGGMACNPYQNLSINELIAEIDTPKKAQDWINFNIEYADEDINDSLISSNPRLDNTINGANIQSLNTTFERGRGICRDGAIAIAALLEDNGYPSYFLSIDFVNDEIGHAVFAYQDVNGLWGSAGINKSDFVKPNFRELEDLAKHISNEFGPYEKHKLYDFSSINEKLVTGTNNGLIIKEPFLRSEIRNGQLYKQGKIEKTEKSYLFQLTNIKHQTRITKEYDPEFFADYFLEENLDNGSFYELTTLARNEKGLPTENLQSVYHSSTNISSNNHYWTTYDEQDRESTVVIEEYDERGDLENYFLVNYEHNDDNTMAAENVHQSNDGDRKFDRFKKSEYDYNDAGEMLTTVYYDYDLDGNWDEVDSY